MARGGAGAEDGGAFFDTTQTSFSDLGVTPLLEEALHARGFSRPSRVQELVIPPLFEGQNAVIAAETGSGKTLAYLAPIATMLLRQKDRAAAAVAAAGDAGGPPPPPGRRGHALILCPSVALCHQVLALAQSLRVTSSDEPVLSAAHISSSNPPPQEAPDLIISTPAAMMGFVTDAGPSYGPLWTPEGLAARVRHVVLDEADLLMGRAFEKPVMQLLQLLRSGDRRRVEAKIFLELSMTKSDFERLPRPMQVAGWAGGSAGLREAGYRVPGGWSKYESTTFGPY